MLSRTVRIARIAMCGVLGLGSLLIAERTFAQTTLPGVVVTAPTPIVRPRPARPRAAPQQSTAAQQPPEQQPTGPQSAEHAPVEGLPIISADDTFVPVTVVTGREIEANQGATLTDTLQQRSGISGSTFAPGANRPIIRGLDSFRVRVQENGIGTHDVAALSEDHGIPIDPFAADQVEVVRGPAILSYGSQAIGGVVSATNNRIPDAIPPRGYTAEIKGGLASVDQGRDGAFKVTAGAGNFALHADGFARRTEDYDTPHGKQRNSFVDSNGYALGSSYVWKDGFIGVAYARFDSLYGIPGIEPAAENARIDMAQEKVSSRGEWRVRDSGIEAIRYWFGWTDYSHDEIHFDGALGGDAVGSRFTNRETEGRLEVQHQTLQTGLGHLTGTAGIQLGRRNTRGLSFEGDSLLEPSRTRTAAAFLFEELQAGAGGAEVGGAEKRQPVAVKIGMHDAEAGEAHVLRELARGVIGRAVEQVGRVDDLARRAALNHENAYGVLLVFPEVEELNGKVLRPIQWDAFLRTKLQLLIGVEVDRIQNVRVRRLRRPVGVGGNHARPVAKSVVGKLDAEAEPRRCYCGRLRRRRTRSKCGAGKCCASRQDVPAAHSFAHIRRPKFPPVKQAHLSR
jgi:hypothetical protein